MNLKCVSCQKKEFKDKKTGDVNRYYKIFLIDERNGVGYVFSNKEIKANTDVKLNALAGADGRLRCVLAD